MYTFPLTHSKKSLKQVTCGEEKYLSLTSKTQDSGDKVHNNNQPSVDLSNQEKNRQQMVK